MDLLKKCWLLLKFIVALELLWMLSTKSHLNIGWGPVNSLRYSWLNYTEADGGPENVCNCSAILQGERETLEQAKLLVLTKDFHKSVQIPNEYYINASQDCRKFKSSRKYFTFPLSKEEKDFPLAYSIVVHQKVQNFERLLRAIYAPQNIYCVHVDKKSETSVFSAILAITSCFPNVFMVSQAVSVVYAAWPRVQADLNCMADLYNTTTEWKYFINLCGQDFPLKTNLEIVRALQLLKGGNSLESEKMPRGKLWRVSNAHHVVNGRIQIDFNDRQHHINSPLQLSQRTGNVKEPPPFNLTILSGNAFIVVNRGYIQSVLEDKRLQALIEWAKDTYSPDEFLWATIQRLPGVPGSKRPSPKYDMTDVNAMARLVKWQGHEGDVHPECQGHHVRGICVYGAGDLQWLLQQHHLFANKFDTDTDPIVVYCLEKYLRTKALAELV